MPVLLPEDYKELLDKVTLDLALDIKRVSHFNHIINLAVVSFY